MWVNSNIYGFHFFCFLFFVNKNLRLHYLKIVAPHSHPSKKTINSIQPLSQLLGLLHEKEEKKYVVLRKRKKLWN